MDKDGNPIASWYDQLGYDVKLVDHWDCPEENDARILTMPNIPKPMHNCAPRTLLGSSVWNFMRKKCYEKANDTCEICGDCPEDKHYRHAHELYSIDYAKQEVKFVRPICVCKNCHLLCIHTGRALTLYKQGSPYYPADSLLFGAEHCFKQISEYNKAHPDEEPLRVFQTWLDYLKEPELEPRMRELIERYDIKFYRVLNKWENKKSYFKKWKMLIGDKWYPTPYESMSEWEEAMSKRNHDNIKGEDHGYKGQFVGDVFDELDKIFAKKS